MGFIFSKSGTKGSKSMGRTESLAQPFGELRRGSVTWNDFSGAPAWRQSKVLDGSFLPLNSLLLKEHFDAVIFQYGLATSKPSRLYSLLGPHEVSKEQN